MINSSKRRRRSLRDQASLARTLEPGAATDRLAFAIGLLGTPSDLRPEHVAAALAIASAPIFGDHHPLHVLAAALDDLADSGRPNQLLRLGLSDMTAELALTLTRLARHEHHAP